MLRNAYSTSGHPMRPNQVRFLNRLLTMHNRPPTFGSQVPRLLLILLGWSLVLTLVVLPSNGYRLLLGTFCLGIVTGMIAVNVALIRMSVRNWPTLDRIIDWTRVEDWAHDPGPPDPASYPIGPVVAECRVDSDRRVHCLSRWFDISANEQSVPASVDYLLIATAG